MRDGKYEPRTAFLRMKQDIESGNPQMWDFSAYRIPENQTPHYRTKDQWKIYPTYDFAHCLCDSFEGITHSLCTTEFMLSRESYEWLNRTLGVYEPMQREYGRLNITGTIMSKRGLTQLVHNKIVKDWDDPRLFTLLGLRRRGVPPDAILSFVQELGVTTAGSVISTTRLDQSIRRYLEVLVPRLMLVLDPVAVVIEDIGELEGQMLDIPFHPKEPMMGNHQVKLTKTIYVDRSDFQETDDPKFFRLAPGKTVGLYKVPFPVKVTGFSKDFTTNLVNEVRVVFCKDGVKPRTYIQWVPESSQAIEVRIYHPLFRSDNPNAVEGGFMKDVNFDSETVFASALVESGFEQVRQRAPWPESAGEGSGHTVGPESVRFQAMRVAYFAMDSDSTSDRVVLNRIVSLKEDPNK
ncbi:ribosomal protein L25/Gln-tRNA synthetase [Xylariaceae sp. FL0662B]|nr:ribosomal protein L25/Gln-tRNA synthetase [Xylariaceae sp. FL0662B]